MSLSGWNILPFAPKWRGTSGAPVSLVPAPAMVLWRGSVHSSGCRAQMQLWSIPSWQCWVPGWAWCLLPRESRLGCLGSLGKMFGCCFFVQRLSEKRSLRLFRFAFRVFHFKKWYLMGEWNFRFVEQYYKRNHWAIFVEVEWHFYGPFSTPAFNINGIANTGEKKAKKKAHLSKYSSVWLPLSMGQF